MGRLEKQWQSFKAACFPPNLSKQQAIDLRRTFFGGAAGFVAVLKDVALEDESTENLYSDLQTELMIFNEDVKAGRA